MTNGKILTGETDDDPEKDRKKTVVQYMHTMNGQTHKALDTRGLVHVERMDRWLPVAESVPPAVVEEEDTKKL